MSDSKGRIKLKINLSNTETEDNVSNFNFDHILNKRSKTKSSIYSDSNQSRDEFKDDDTLSYTSSKKSKENNLQKKIISIISKLTKIACICEDKNNNLNDNMSASMSTSLNDTNSDNVKTYKKLIKQMHKYEKCLLNINYFLNDKNNNNNLDEVTFPNGLIKAVDDYISADYWIYKYLLIECKKYNDKYRNLVQNIATFDSTLKNKIINNDTNEIVMPVYAAISKEDLNSVDDSTKNYYKHVHIPEQLADHYFKAIKKRNTNKEQEVEK
ncbi:conserved protein, unknown function [Hepatocystis sp. ex Piliocolobus tephrosceles]|nr:conserved protein, unknown function [Hepatocystis sp. ex Piliocolobus tephrosceles]